MLTGTDLNTRAINGGEATHLCVEHACTRHVHKLQYCRTVC